MNVVFFLKKKYLVIAVLAWRASGGHTFLVAYPPEMTILPLYLCATRSFAASPAGPPRAHPNWSTTTSSSSTLSLSLPPRPRRKQTKRRRKQRGSSLAARSGTGWERERRLEDARLLLHDPVRVRCAGRRRAGLPPPRQHRLPCGGRRRRRAPPPRGLCQPQGLREAA